MFSIIQGKTIWRAEFSCEPLPPPYEGEGTLVCSSRLCSLLISQTASSGSLSYLWMRAGSSLSLVFALLISDQRCGSGALRPPVLPEGAKNHQGHSADCCLQFERHPADPQEGEVTCVNAPCFLVSRHPRGREAEDAPDVSGSH